MNESGKRSFVFDTRKSLTGTQTKIPCGQCLGCRLERSRQWAIRCEQESKLWRHNCFVTLTYDDEHLPSGGTLVREDLQKFLKRLRVGLSRSNSVYAPRYFGCGEYGEQSARPHYHLILFNCRFDDQKHYSTRNGYDVFTSEKLQRYWKLGRTEIGSVTFESAAYVARYCVGKITGDAAEAHYRGRLPEFAAMSLKPGIGYNHFIRFRTDIYPNDFVVANGQKMAPPRYYDELLERFYPDLAAKVFAARDPKSADDHEKAYYEKQSARLRVREEVATGRLTKRGNVA